MRFLDPRRARRPIRGALQTLLLLGAASAIAPRAEALTIVVMFTQRWNNVANWGGNAQLQMQATAVMNQAALNWMLAIQDNFTLTVTVDWGNPIAFFNEDGGVCGVGGIKTTQMVNGVEKPLTAEITMNSALLNQFFIDPTPAEDSEFLAIFGLTWSANARPGGPAVNKVDMLSCAKHEFGHCLGFHYSPAAGVFVPYIAQVVGNLGIAVNDFGGITLPTGPITSLNDASHFSPNGFIPGTQIPMRYLLMTPMLQNGVRVSMSPYDVSAVARILGIAPGMGLYTLYPKGVTGTGGVFCAGDGSGTPCPCNNNGQMGNGCGNSLAANGANLGSVGTSRLSADTLVLIGTGMPNASALYFQGTSDTNGGLGAVFGDGIRCVSGSIVRLGLKTNTMGGSRYPSPGDASISAQGQVQAIGTRYYQVWYRNAANFCTPATFNLTNGWQVVWNA